MIYYQLDDKQGMRYPVTEFNTPKWGQETPHLWYSQSSLYKILSYVQYLDSFPTGCLLLPGTMFGPELQRNSWIWWIHVNVEIAALLLKNFPAVYRELSTWSLSWKRLVDDVKQTIINFSLEFRREVRARDPSATDQYDGIDRVTFL